MAYSTKYPKKNTPSGDRKSGGNKSAGYRDSKSGGYRENKSGYRGSDNKSGYHGSKAAGDNKSGYRGSDNKSGYHGSKAAGDNKSGYRGDSKSNYRGSSRRSEDFEKYNAYEVEPAENPAVEPENELVCGRNAVAELMESTKSIDCVYFVNDNENAKHGPLAKLFATAKAKGLVIKEVSTAKLDELCGGVYHQGIAARCAAAEYVSVAEILDYAKQKGEDPFIIVADGIEDPHNLGAIIRTAEACGAHGILIPKRRSASVNATVYRTSAGAAGVMRIARVTNLVSEMKELKEQGIWFYCADMDGQRWDQVNYSGGVGLVIGAEGNGVSRLVKETCDMTVSLPMCGQINSLNASVAAGILMYEVLRGRIQKA
jgi:23S rRNA (guanosine2251-2'-O)-methyltransferase